MSGRRLRALYNRLFRRKQIDMVLKEFHFEDNTWNLRAEHPAVGEVARILGAYFIELGADNFVEMTMFDPATIGMFTLSMQRMGHPNAGQVRDNMRAALEQIHAHPEQAAAISQRVLSELGYLKQGDKAP